MTVSVGQTIATLRARAERIRAAHATQAATLRERLATAIATLLPSHAKAWLIGSLAWGGFGERSDVDVVVRGLTPQAATRLDLALLRALEWTVEVLRFEELPDSFRERILREGIALHGR